MMKKNGFTLAEVLITLAIIGVVATLTLPSLITNTAEQQAVTAYRKAINTLNEAGQMNVAVDGFDYSQLSQGTDGPTSNPTIDENGIMTQSLFAVLANRAQVDITASNDPKVPGAGCTGKSQIYFRDGTVLCYTPTATNSPDDTTDGFIDTNGVKGPNQVSTCSDADCKPGSRQIKDQFPVTLRGTNALPGVVTFANGTPTEASEGPSYAARWVMRK